MKKPSLVSLSVVSVSVLMLVPLAELSSATCWLIGPAGGLGSIDVCAGRGQRGEPAMRQMQPNKSREAVPH